MSRTSLFFNSKIEKSGFLCEVADFCLAPTRYLFGGRSIRILEMGEKKGAFHHVASFHPCGARNVSSTDETLHSENMSMWKTALAIVTLVPGLMVGFVFKCVVFLFTDLSSNYEAIIRDVEVAAKLKASQNIAEMLGKAIGKGLLSGLGEASKDNDSDTAARELQTLLNETLEMRWRNKISSVRILGNPQGRETSYSMLQKLDKLAKQDRPIDTLVIYADAGVLNQGLNHLGISEEFQQQTTLLDKILALNPMRVVVIGEGELPKQLPSKWQFSKASSLKEALEEKASLRQYLPCKEWHLFQHVSVVRPVVSAAPKKSTARPFRPNIHGLHG